MRLVIVVKVWTIEVCEYYGPKESGLYTLLGNAVDWKFLDNVYVSINWAKYDSVRIVHYF